MSKKFLAFDIGGTTIKYGLIDQQLELSHCSKVPTEHNKDGHIITSVLDITQKMLAQFDVLGIGVSTAGIVGDHGEIIYAGPTIPNYQGTQIKQQLSQLTRLPIFVVNDVDAALLGEVVAGVAKNCSSAYCVALGTGIGGAYYNGGKLFSGSHSFANSLGYTLYDQADDSNYEQLASTLTLEKNLQPYGIGVIDAFAQAKSGDTTCLKAIEDWAYQVARGLANIVLLYDPAKLVIGGAVSQQGDFLLDILRRQMQKLIPEGLFATELVTAKLTNQAQLLGAISKFVDNYDHSQV